MSQRDICKLLASESVSAAYTHPLVSKTGSSDSKIISDTKCGAVSSFSLSALMSSPDACSSSSSHDRVQKMTCRPKRRVDEFDEDQENIDPAVSRLPVSKKHCSKDSDSAVRRKNTIIDHFLATKCDKVPAGHYAAMVSQTTAASQRYGNSKASRDFTIKFALNRSDDRLHGLTGDFSQSYCLPFIENDKHRDLKAISCHTVSVDYFSLQYRQVAQPWQSDHTSPAILRGWVTLRLNFRLKDYVLREYLWTVR